MTDATTTSPRPARRAFRAMLAGAALVAAGVVATSATPAAATDIDHDWLATVNTYRAMSGLAPVAENTTWSAEGQAHSCYMLLNGISHDEIPGRPGYTPGGDVAGNSGNVAVSSSITTTPRDHVELWMTGPFHAIGVLRHSLRTSGFGLCAQQDTPTPWRSGGTLDVIRGIDHTAVRPSTPILFPGDGATVPLHSFITEFPNPLTMCGWSGAAGLPLIAMMPSDVSSANSSLVGPNGPIETCTLHKGNVSDATARSILDGDNAVIVMPRVPLQDGAYSATVNSNGGNVTWSFSVDRDAPLSATAPGTPPIDVPDDDTTTALPEARFEPVSPFRLVDTRVGKGAKRLQAGKVTRIDVTTPDVQAVSANFVAVGPTGHGFLTAFNCTGDVPLVSTLNYRPAEVVANQAVVPLDDGDLCVYSLTSTDLVIDVNGFFHDDATSTFTPEVPERVYDSREGNRKPLAAKQELVLQVAGDGRAAPGHATSVALNVTVDQPVLDGFLRVYPCGSQSGKEISSVNYLRGESRPNSVVVPVDANGRICLQALTQTDVIVDYTGYFSADAGLDFMPLDPIRLFDSRTNGALNESTNGARLDAGEEIRIKIAGVRGVPADATAASVNLTATEPLAGTYLTAYPCGNRPATSTVNLLPHQATSANGAMVRLSGSGELCVFAFKSVHVIVDINGVFV